MIRYVFNIYSGVSMTASETARPEYSLPAFLQESINTCIEKEREYNSGKHVTAYDCYFDELYGDINYAEVEGMISHELAEYLRKKYL